MTGKRGMPVVGVDGCRTGWICVSFSGDPSTAQFAIFHEFSEIIGGFPNDAIIGVDMPIGLPECAGEGGRGPEMLIRPLLGERQSSVFSIPARAAVYCDDYREACGLALEKSHPPRRVSRQAFNLFPKIREVDRFIRSNLEAGRRIIEVHPEFALRELNGGNPMQLPKKIKGRANPSGIEERKSLLLRHGFGEKFLSATLPAGVGADDDLV